MDEQDMEEEEIGELVKMNHNLNANTSSPITHDSQPIAWASVSAGMNIEQWCQNVSQSDGS